MNATWIAVGKSCLANMYKVQVFKSFKTKVIYLSNKANFFCQFNSVINHEMLEEQAKSL